MTSPSSDDGPPGERIRRLVRTAAEPYDVSVVIPAHQASDVIGRAILSAFAQRPRPVADVIVVQDRLTDRCDAAEALGAVVVRQPVTGSGGAFETGLRAARTRWVAVLDPDDEWLPGHLATLMPYTPGAVLVAGRARAVPSGRLVGSPSRVVQRIGPREVIWPRGSVAPSAVVFDRERTLAVGGSGSGAGAFLELWLRLLETGPGVLVPEVTCLYADHPGKVGGAGTGLRRARAETLARHADAAWFDPALPALIAAVEGWDVFREAAARTIRQRLRGRFR